MSIGNDVALLMNNEFCSASTTQKSMKTLYKKEINSAKTLDLTSQLLRKTYFSACSALSRVGEKLSIFLIECVSDRSSHCFPLLNFLIFSEIIKKAILMLGFLR